MESSGFILSNWVKIIDHSLTIQGKNRNFPYNVFAKKTKTLLVEVVRTIFFEVKQIRVFF